MSGVAMDALALDPRLRAQDAASTSNFQPSTSSDQTQPTTAPGPTPTSLYASAGSITASAESGQPSGSRFGGPTSPATAGAARHLSTSSTSTPTGYHHPQQHYPYPPPTHHSTASPQDDHHGNGEADDGHNDSGLLAGDGSDPKKPRACESCRSLKVRCDPDPANPDGPCKRCAKAGRQCLVTQPTRKRQKKTDSRVAELEKKIDALTASLQATRGAPGMAPRDEPPAPMPEYGPLKVGLASGWTSNDVESPPAMRQARQQRHSQSHSPYGMDDRGHSYPSPSSATIAPPPPPPPQQLPPMVMAGQKRKHAESTPEDSPAADRGRTPSQPTPAAPAVAGREYTDIVDRGLITMAKANELFQRYTDQMVHHLPGVVFPEGTTAADLRRTKPILFNAILAGAASESPNLQRSLVRELMQTFADQIIIVGKKSLELVQALQVSVIWYFPPENFEELKFYQLVHIAAVMAIDIGLGRKVVARRRIPYNFRDHPFKKSALPDPCSAESRRAWLTSYFLASNTSMALHRPNLIRWAPFMQQCVEYLTTAPDASPSDKYLCHLVWTHRMAEEVGVQFSLDDTSNGAVNMSDHRTQYALKGFERDIEKYQAGVTEELMQPSLKLSFHVLSLYMHEIALQPDGSNNTCEDLQQPSFLSEHPQLPPSQDKPDTTPVSCPLAPTNITPAHINAVSACLTAIDGIFDTFLTMDVTAIRCLPVFNHVRVAYATVVFIKIYLAVSAPGSELGKVIDKESMRVEHHLEALLTKFRLTAADDKSRPATKFTLVLALIRSWFLKQSKGDAPEKDAADTPAPARAAATRSSDTSKAPSQMTASGTPYSTTANTPLQLLSEIATNDGAANANASSNGFRAPVKSAQYPWMAPGGSAPQPFMYDAQTSAAGGAGNSAGWLGGLGGADSLMDFDYTTMGDGLSQAMDFTLAGFNVGSAGAMGGMDMGGGGAAWGQNLFQGFGGDNWLDGLQFQL